MMATEHPRTQPAPKAKVGAGLAELIDQMRNRLRIAFSSLYLIYTLIYAFKAEVVPAALLSSARYQVALVALIILVLSLLRVIRGQRANLAVQLGTVPVLLYAAFDISQGSTVDQVSYLLWAAVMLPPLFLHGDAKYGALASALFIGVLALGVFSGRVGTADTHLIWIGGLLALATLAVIGYLIMSFIERNLLLHVQTSGELEAARLDALTGIPGRAMQEKELQKAIEQAKRNRAALSIIVADIDHFKQVNDVHGHNAGDDVLRSFAKRLRRNVGASGTVGRWGGEEFLIFMPGMSREDALVLGERLRREVSQSAIAGLPITASFGVASLRPPKDDLEQLFSRADERLYEAKNAGRNTVR